MKSQFKLRPLQMEAINAGSLVTVKRRIDIGHYDAVFPGNLPEYWWFYNVLLHKRIARRNPFGANKSVITIFNHGNAKVQVLITQPVREENRWYWTAILTKL